MVCYEHFNSAALRALLVPRQTFPDFEVYEDHVAKRPPGIVVLSRSCDSTFQAQLIVAAAVQQTLGGTGSVIHLIDPNGSSSRRVKAVTEQSEKIATAFGLQAMKYRVTTPKELYEANKVEFAHAHAHAERLATACKTGGARFAELTACFKMLGKHDNAQFAIARGAAVITDPNHPRYTTPVSTAEIEAINFDGFHRVTPLYVREVGKSALLNNAFDQRAQHDTSHVLCLES